MKTLSLKLPGISLLVLLLFATACKKEKTVPAPTLRGFWHSEISGTGLIRTLNFDKDSVYSTIYSRSPAIYFVPFLFKGAYQVQGNRLTMRFKAENFSKSPVLPDGFSASVNWPGEYELFTDATFSLTSGQLNIKHTSATGGQPQTTVVTFYRSATD
ncbi:hypothetical protein [Mucilaginibacter sp. CSA2-8R]|uniref:hypothetical protein n=1 Tax=Mucilaginibacter sp. CSA2-8R TaxID=3141542 RepID=UPI00315C4E38